MPTGLSTAAVNFLPEGKGTRKAVLIACIAAAAIVAAIISTITTIIIIRRHARYQRGLSRKRFCKSSDLVAFTSV